MKRKASKNRGAFSISSCKSRGPRPLGANVIPAFTRPSRLQRTRWAPGVAVLRVELLTKCPPSKTEDTRVSVVLEAVPLIVHVAKAVDRSVESSGGILDTGHQNIAPPPGCLVQLSHEVAAGSCVTGLDTCTHAMPSSEVDREALRIISEKCLNSVFPV